MSREQPDVVTEVPCVSFAWWWSAVWLLAYAVARPLRIVLIDLALRRCGVKKAARARLAVRQADRNSSVMLLKLFRSSHRNEQGG
jgi:hypothetical protein